MIQEHCQERYVTNETVRSRRLGTQRSPKRGNNNFAVHNYSFFFFHHRRHAGLSRVHYFVIKHSVPPMLCETSCRLDRTQDAAPGRAADLRHRLRHASEWDVGRGTERDGARSPRMGHPLSRLHARYDTNGHAHVKRNASVTSWVSPRLAKNFAA